MLFFIVLIVLIVALVVTNIVIVPQAQSYVVECLGQYKCTWGAGLHVKIPIIERVVRKVSLKEQVLDFPPQPVITKDNVTMQIDSVVFCSIFDARLYTYGVENPLSGLQNLAATTLRNIIGEMELDSTLTSRDDINTRMRAVLDEATDAWGMKVNRVEIKNIQPPHEIEDVMTKQMRAERERRQTVLEAQAHQEAVGCVFSFFACCFFNARVNFSFFLWLWSFIYWSSISDSKSFPGSQERGTELEMSEGRNILVALPSETSLSASIPFNRRTPSLIFASLSFWIPFASAS